MIHNLNKLDKCNLIHNLNTCVLKTLFTNNNPTAHNCLYRHKEGKNCATVAFFLFKNDPSKDSEARNMDSDQDHCTMLNHLSGFTYLI